MIGFSEGFHDAAVAVVNNDEILFAAHSERYSKKKHDKKLDLHSASIAQCMNMFDETVAFYENPLIKRSRQLVAGQSAWRKERNLALEPTVYFDHHKSHAAAAFQTSSFDRSACVVIDSIGEWDCSSIWIAEMSNGKATYEKVWSRQYPNSLGLWYSALTKWAGLKPLDEEYVFMGMAAFGEPSHTKALEELLSKNNHRGIRGLEGKDVDVAKSAEVVLEEEVGKLFQMATKYSDNICYGGGVALNCVVNSKIQKRFSDYNIWIMPNPGDAGAALGAALLANEQKVQFSPYLGHNINRKIDPKEVVNCILKNKIAGVANGRAEFGPRALGNRSLLADPREISTKDLVNTIKQRQKFRPFAPAILEEHCHEYFDMPDCSRYMSYTYQCNLPDAIPACLHVDNSARVQTVPETSESILRPILECWYERTGCPVLLNTSLNIRGMPMVNDWDDAELFAEKYSVDVF